ncbi:MAG: ATP-binding protein [Candidatus Margulisiibacteriota bacterium]
MNEYILKEEFMRIVRRNKSDSRPCAGGGLSAFVKDKVLGYGYKLLCRMDDIGDRNVIATLLFFCTGREVGQLAKQLLIILQDDLNDPSALYPPAHWQKLQPEEVIGELYDRAKYRRQVAQSISQLLAGKLAGPGKNYRCLLSKRLGELAKMFRLNEVEQEILLMKYLYVYQAHFENLSDSCVRMFGYKDRNNTISASLISVFSGLPLPKINRALDANSSLIRNCLLDEARHFADELGIYLNGQSSVPLNNRYFQKVKGASVSLERSTVPAKDQQLVKDLLANRDNKCGLNVLLYGEPGTGKTAFSRTLGEALGYEVYEIKPETGDDTAGFRFRALQACMTQVPTQNTLIVVDEADAMLNVLKSGFSFRNSFAEKGYLNNLLENHKHNLIWITNHSVDMDSSSRRRFDHAVHFPRLNYLQRQSIWTQAVRKYKLTALISPEDVSKLADRYEANAGNIHSALCSCQRIFKKKPKGRNILETVDTFMQSQLQLMGQRASTQDGREPNSASYGLDGLNIKGDLGHSLKALERFNEYWEKHDKALDIRNMNVLLYGPPGTGKTEFAKYLARHLSRRLLVTQASDLLSKWVGESEKQIRDLFERAQQEKAIIFLDEADGLFSSREYAQASWQVTQVNELLTNMEKFHGILICSTNFKKHVDSAAIRRFNLKLEFDYLNGEGNLIFYDRFFKPLLNTPLNDSQKQELQGLSNLTPGDFKIVYQQNAFMEPAKIGHQDLIRALAEELRHKDSSLTQKWGFSAGGVGCR